MGIQEVSIFFGMKGASPKHPGSPSLTAQPSSPIPVCALMRPEGPSWHESFSCWGGWLCLEGFLLGGPTLVSLSRSSPHALMCVLGHA